MSKRKLAAVTGSSRGIGQAIARHLARAGYDLLLISRQSQALIDTADSIRTETGGNVDVAFADLLDEESCIKAVASKDIDVLVNCGIYHGAESEGRIDQVTSAELLRVMQANVLTQVGMAKATLPGLLAKGRGAIVQLVSSSSRMKPTRSVDKGGFQAFGYTASKAAIAKLIPLLAVEYSDFPNIRFFNVDPGLVITDKMRQEGTSSRFQKWGANPPDATGAVVAFLCESEHSKVKKYHGAEYIDAPALCRELNLMPARL
jgi:short-subunit dehydrogenase